ncbi:hypothetical protein Acr_06g0013660 [Actinidia rufa]|uniref:Fe2OG dioxygenase domain-containing protein n=1 Tax=Actinidia rufa TaxID=165716 RepID=A0A7J0ET75_9ERIC|nr:hypothetical protein Acr_06g0013660 [Actinidia rufa]
MAAATQGLVQTSLETNTQIQMKRSPIIDFSLLTSRDPNQRSKVIQDLNKVCQDWGFFMLVNHGVPESLMKAVLDGSKEFFNLPMEEKMEFAEKDLWKPIKFGTGVDIKVENFFFWRDFLKVFVHPQFHFPNKPKGFSEVSGEYCKRTREVARELLQGISEALGLEENYIEKAMDLESGFQLFAANLYPQCPQPELAMGIPAHTDHGLLTLLIENDIGGLQIQHNGKWFNVLSNGKYKSIRHRAIVNNKATRISLAVVHGPSLDTVVSPAPELVESENTYHPCLMIPRRLLEAMMRSVVFSYSSNDEVIKNLFISSIPDRPQHSQRDWGPDYFDPWLPRPVPPPMEKTYKRCRGYPGHTTPP